MLDLGDEAMTADGNVTVHRVSVEPHAVGLATRGDGRLVAIVGGRRALLIDPFETPLKVRHELTLLRPASSVAWITLGASDPDVHLEDDEGEDEEVEEFREGGGDDCDDLSGRDGTSNGEAMLVGMDNGRVEVWLPHPVTGKYENSVVLDHPTAAGAGGLSAVPGRWPASSRVKVVAGSRKEPGLVATAENRRIHLWLLDDDILAGSDPRSLSSSTVTREPLMAMKFNPHDPNTLAVGDASSFISIVDRRLFNNREATESLIFGKGDAHSGTAVRALTWLEGAEAQVLASTGDDGVVRVWDMRRPDTALGTIRAHVGPGSCLTAGKRHMTAGSSGTTEDGRFMLASGGLDGRVRLWNWSVRSGEDIELTSSGVSSSSGGAVPEASNLSFTASASEQWSPHTLSERVGGELDGSGTSRGKTSFSFRPLPSIPENIVGVSLCRGVLVAANGGGLIARKFLS